MELKLRDIIHKYKLLLNIEDNIKLEFVNFKTKIASISFKTKKLRINKNIINKLSEKHLEYIILHELVHLKLNCKYHTKEFYNLLNKFYNNEEIKEIEHYLYCLSLIK